MKDILRMLNEFYETNRDRAIIARRRSAKWEYSHMRSELRWEATRSIDLARQAQKALKILKQDSCNDSN